MQVRNKIQIKSKRLIWFSNTFSSSYLWMFVHGFRFFSGHSITLSDDLLISSLLCISFCFLCFLLLFSPAVEYVFFDSLDFSDRQNAIAARKDIENKFTIENLNIFLATNCSVFNTRNIQNQRLDSEFFRPFSFCVVINVIRKWDFFFTFVDDTISMAHVESFYSKHSIDIDNFYFHFNFHWRLLWWKYIWWRESLTIGGVIRTIFPRL